MGAENNLAIEIIHLAISVLLSGRFGCQALLGKGWNMW